MSKTNAAVIAGDLIGPQPPARRKRRRVPPAVAAYLAGIGARGGKAGRGAAKARSSEQARAAVNARWKKGEVAVLVALALASGACATRRAPVLVLAQSVMSLPVCSMDTGVSLLPDPCREQVAPGEWLRVSAAKPLGVGDPNKHPARKWWATLLALLLI